MELSVVTSLYRSEAYINEFYRRVCAAAEGITEEFEIILVNDGSPDDSLQTAISLFEEDARVRVIDLSRNFGQHRAMMTGLAHARGRLVFLLDCDLEEPPELLLKFHERLEKEGADVIYGIQLRRKGGLWERISGAAFYRLYNILSTAPLPESLVTVRLMTKRYVSALVQHRDREIFLAGLWQITGFRQFPEPVVKLSKGSSSYNLRRKMALVVNAITSFSNKPLVYVFYLGLAMMVSSSAAACYLILRRMFVDVLLSGWASLIISVWMIGGLTIFCLGILGIYLSKIFMETKDRPYTIIRELYERRTPEAERTGEQRLREQRGGLL